MAFGVANVEDIPGYFDGELTRETFTEEEYEEDDEKPWDPWQPLDQQTKIGQHRRIAINHLSGEGPPHNTAATGPKLTAARCGVASEPAGRLAIDGARHEIV